MGLEVCNLTPQRIQPTVSGLKRSTKSGFNLKCVWSDFDHDFGQGVVQRILVFTSLKDGFPENIPIERWWWCDAYRIDSDRRGDRISRGGMEQRGLGPERWFFEAQEIQKCLIIKVPYVSLRYPPFSWDVEGKAEDLLKEKYRCRRSWKTCGIWYAATMSCLFDEFSSQDSLNF